MKKLAMLMLVVMLAVLVAGCTATAPDPAPTAEPTEEPVVDMSYDCNVTYVFSVLFHMICAFQYSANADVFVHFYGFKTYSV